MSFNRTTYDSCQYSADLIKSTSPLYYQLDPSRYYNCNKCFMLGSIIGGPSVSHTNSNIVDVESELLGVSRIYNRCPTQNYTPQKNTIQDNGAVGDGIVLPKHLKTCFFVQHKRPTNTGIYTEYPSCQQITQNLQNKKNNHLLPVNKQAYASFN